MDFYSLVYPFTEKDCENFAYYFTDRNIRAPYIVTVAKWLDRLRREVDVWRSRWSDSNQVRPRLHLQRIPTASMTLVLVRFSSTP